MNLNDFNDYFDVELESDDVDTIAGYYLTGVGTIPTTEKLSYELVSQNKQLILTNDKSEKWTCYQGKSPNYRS